MSIDALWVLIDCIGNRYVARNEMTTQTSSYLIDLKRKTKEMKVVKEEIAS